MPEIFAVQTSNLVLMGKKMNLNELLRNGESEIVEFKKSLGEWKEIVETVSAFFNTKGDTIVVSLRYFENKVMRQICVRHLF